MAVILPPKEVVTPFGRVVFPGIETPPGMLPRRPDERTKQAIRQALGEDLSYFPGLIPWVGTIIGDFLADTHHREVVRLLSLEERERLMEFEKALPTTAAVVRTLLFPKGV